MNKVNLKSIVRHQPVKLPSPDYKNRNIVSSTAPPTHQIKKYLHFARENTHEKVAMDRNVLINLLQNQQLSRVRSNEEILRKRIIQLEQENNEFISYVKEYDLLVDRNRQLEEQMLLLLQELQMRQDSISDNQVHQVTKRENNSAKEKIYNTTQSSRQSHDEDNEQLNRSQQKQLEIKLKQFNSSTLDQSDFVKENAFLKAENQRIKDMVDLQIRASISTLQSKFMNYITSMQDKIAAMKTTNQEIAKLKLDPSSKSLSKHSNNDSIQNFHQEITHKDIKLQQNWNQWEKSSHNSSQNKNNFPTNLTQNNNIINPIPLQSSNQPLSNQDSQVNIEVSCLSDSNQSFGVSTHKKPAYQQIQNSNYFQNIHFVESQQLHQPHFQKIVLDRIWQNLNSLRENLTFILGQKSQIKDPTIIQAEIQIQSQIRKVIDNFFPKSLSNQNSKQLFPSMQQQRQKQSENMQMKLKIRDLNDKIYSLQHQLKMKVQQPLPNIPFTSRMVASQKYLQNSYYNSLSSSDRIQFQETKQKLIQVINIMKSFNQEYRHILDQSLVRNNLTQPKNIYQS